MKQPSRRLAVRLRAASLAGFLVLVLPPVATPPARGTERLADALRELYAAPVPGERWRRRPTVRMPDGEVVPRERALRSDPLFVPAARRLLASRAGDEAPLGAWLLGTASKERWSEVEPLLVRSLARTDERVVFEATEALALRGGAASRGPLEVLARSAPWPAVRTAASLGAEDVARRSGERVAGDLRRAPGAAGLGPRFRRGVSWWVGEGREDGGRASFRRLARLGVTWVSIHTFDPLQRGLHDPELAPPSGRFRIQNLDVLVRNAHEAGLAVMLKPHLEMRGYEPTAEERRVLRGGDGPARRRLFARMETSEAWAERGMHNRIEMRSETDWRRWFAGYEAWLLPYARAARAAGVDMLCVGRELDTTVIRREADWRRLIARVRREFEGPLVYSANFDTWSRIRLWDALDFIGVSAYFPLSDRPDPTLADLEAGWARALLPLEAAARRFGRPVLLTEAGFPSLPSAASAPWREGRAPADVWLQARCYEATLRALAARPFVEGAFFWLWERTSAPPFRDPSHAIVDKPASFVMARWYSARDGRGYGRGSGSAAAR